MMKRQEIQSRLDELERELGAVETRRTDLLQEIGTLREAMSHCASESSAPRSIPESRIAGATLSAMDRVRLFRELFRGREDVFPRRFESIKTGRSGYQPVCANQWRDGICPKPKKVQCSACEHRAFTPLSDEIVRCHLLGHDPDDPNQRDFTIGVYPLLEDETCWFLAADFDKSSWRDDAATFMETCRHLDVPAALERSRSGNGGHIWIFFSRPVPASLARKLGSFLLTETMDRRPELGFDSYDRFFPNQDTMPKGGLGNLIALPLQKRPRARHNSIFLDPTTLEPWSDQWGFLASLSRMSQEAVESLARQAERQGRITGVQRVEIEEETERDRPWAASAPRSHDCKMPGPLPKVLSLVLANQIYIAKADLTPPLRTRLLRLAAFQNPEFYKAQAMRMPVYSKPRIICCAEDFPNHIALPRGCLDETLALLTANGIRGETTDERHLGSQLEVSFQGRLRPEQQPAAEALLNHDTGVLCASTAFGKTVVAAYILAQRKVNALILVHRGQLLEQWVERLALFLGLAPSEIGRIGSGKRKPTGRIDVATIQSLFAKNTVDELVEQYGHVIVDECHHLSARSFEAVTRQCKAKYFLGLSATVTRQDGHHPIIFMQCGPVRWRVSDREQAAQRPFDHRVIVRETQFEPPPAMRESAGWTVQQYFDCLVADPARNDLIVADVLLALGQGHSPVVITERTAHADVLAARLGEHCENVITFKGGQGVKQRRLLKERLEAVAPDAPRILVATGRYLGEGFDDSRLDTLFLALPVSWRGVLTQYAGRLHRLHDGKREVIVYDYADLRVAMLARMFQRRQRGYHAIGYEIGPQRATDDIPKESFLDGDNE